MKHVFSTLLLAFVAMASTAQNETIDISGDNTDKNYVSYSKSIKLEEGTSLDVKMARYCYFSSTITGSGTLNLYAGGERCYLGTTGGKTWPNWTKYTGDIHVYPYPENSASAGFYGVVVAFGGKSSSPESVYEDYDGGKVNPSMANNRVILHQGATICTESNTAGSGFRIGELQTEEGSMLMGYMKKGRNIYYLLGGLNTDATLAGTIAPAGNDANTLLSILKEGTGTYTITGNENFLSGGLRVLDGKVLVMNDRAEAEAKKLSGAIGAKPSADDAVVYVFENGILGGTGSIGGTVNNYGTIQPGAEETGLLTLKNYAKDQDAHLIVHSASTLCFRIGSTSIFDQLSVDGDVKYYPITQDFDESDQMPVVQVVLNENADVKVGDEFKVLTAKRKTSLTSDWHFEVKANQYTWEVVEREEDGGIAFVLRLVSYDQMETKVPDTPEIPESTMGSLYDDGIDDAKDKTTLREYATKNGKFLGTAISMWKNDLSNSNLGETKEVGAQFNMLVAENEMKWDALEPSRNSFSYGSADNLVKFAQNHEMRLRGHCLAWHSQLPTWVSSDGKKNDKNWTREEALQILKNHVEKVVKHYKGKVAEWDVVNECLDDDQSIVRSNTEGYTLRKNSMWTQAVGDAFIDSAFVWAHRADPDAELYLNDYGVEFSNKAKTVSLYNLAMRLKKKGIPIDGVGIQCHFSVGDVDSVMLDRTIRRFAEAGLKCIITELDMGISSTSSKNLEEQARNYRVITDIVLNNDNCPSMVIWGLKDNNSWRESSNPLLYTSSIGKKPAWYAVRSALRHRIIVNETTGVQEVRLEPATSVDVFYDLQGRRVSHPTKGLYLSNGKKVVIR
jgi:GH35 family endo-1,4-beta-xylanase